jgi:hypothetical protein
MRENTRGYRRKTVNLHVELVSDVACGYSQIAGVDFTENYAPVINNITWRILIVAMIVWKLDTKIVNV